MLKFSIQPFYENLKEKQETNMKWPLKLWWWSFLWFLCIFWYFCMFWGEFFWFLFSEVYAALNVNGDLIDDQILWLRLSTTFRVKIGSSSGIIIFTIWRFWDELKNLILKNFLMLYIRIFDDTIPQSLNFSYKGVTQKSYVYFNLIC